MCAFFLHQMTEHLLHTLIVVFTLYRHRSHKLEFLEEQAIGQYGQIRGIFPRETRQQRRAFTTLQDAYVNARYDNGAEFQVRHEDVLYLAQRIELLERMVLDVCRDRIGSYEPTSGLEPYEPPEQLLNLEELQTAPPPKELIAQQREALEQAQIGREVERKEKEAALKQVDAERKARKLEREARELERKARKKAEEAQHRERKEKERLQALLQQAGIDVE